MTGTTTETAIRTMGHFKERGIITTMRGKITIVNAEKLQRYPSISEEERRLVAANYADHQSQCYVAMPWRDFDGRTWRLQDLAGPSVYNRRGGDLTWQGLYLDMPAWGYHVFELKQGDRNRGRRSQSKCSPSARRNPRPPSAWFCPECSCCSQSPPSPCRRRP